MQAHIDWKMLWSVMAVLGYVGSADSAKYEQQTSELLQRNWITEDVNGRLLLNIAEADGLIEDAFMSGAEAERRDIMQYLANKRSS
jgi:hypothetical protein